LTLVPLDHIEKTVKESLAAVVRSEEIEKVDNEYDWFRPAALDLFVGKRTRRFEERN
jgi:hypothetical protein